MEIYGDNSFIFIYFFKQIFKGTLSYNWRFVNEFFDGFSEDFPQRLKYCFFKNIYFLLNTFEDIQQDF